MNLAAVEQIAKAVLYEGYLLYPYRRSSIKNQQRWNFGVLYPAAYAEAQSGTDSSTSQTECIIAGSETPTLELRVRFLQLVERTIGKFDPPIDELTTEHRPVQVNHLEIDGKDFQPWQEAVEREIVFPLVFGQTLNFGPALHTLTFSAGKELEPIRDSSGQIAGLIIREHGELQVGVELSAQSCSPDVFRITIRTHNLTRFTMECNPSREAALVSSLLSAHLVLGATSGHFVSLLEPPAGLRDFVAQCRNVGTWPVLVGAAGEQDTILSSPIILYDYPEIAPESAGDLFDGTEIDEILSLRIMTLTDDEKLEIRQSDDRARQILERTETLPPEQFMKLHGVVRSVRPLKEEAS
ncbi:MAG TPA: hypothetical protein VFR08_14550 [Candidatus Angelobacter sp.]|nr:hypothetical protein [Candidatus Angelobacter sp.]